MSVGDEITGVVDNAPGAERPSIPGKLAGFGTWWPWAGAWYFGRLCRQKLLWLFFKTVGRYGFRQMGHGTIIDGWVQFVWPCGDIRLGEWCRIGRRCVFHASRTSRIRIGSRVTINDGCFLTSLFSITVGDGTSIGEYTSIRDYDHRFDDVSKPIKDQGYRGDPIEIGRDCWIGRGCLVTAGVRIGDGSVIGANSVVTRSIPPFSVAVGAPARVIRQRGEPRLHPRRE